LVEIAYGDKEDEAVTRVKVDDDNPQETETNYIKLEGKRKRGMLCCEELRYQGT